MLDTIVIGSGAGGLTAALALARSGQTVLVLEQHDIPGGWCRTFTRGGHRFSPGVHYIGALGEGEFMRAIYEGMGLAQDLEFIELNPDGYEHVQIGDVRFDFPKGKSALAVRLKGRFPSDCRGIDRYLDLVSDVGTAARYSVWPTSLLRHPVFAFKLLRHGLRSLDSVLREYIDDPVCRAILSIQCGDHGLPPREALFAVHARVQHYYFNGGYYPLGGGTALPNAMIKALEKYGGEIRLQTRVAEILLEQHRQRKRAVGVKLDDGTEIRARRIISNAYPEITFRHLVGEHNLSEALQKRLDATKWSISTLSLYLATDMDVREPGMDSGNYWYARDPDLDTIYDATRTVIPEGDDFPFAFLTVTSLKDPFSWNGREHTMEVFTPVPYEPFAVWANSHTGNRPAAYLRFKEELTERMLNTAEKIVPGIRDGLTFVDLATPLTNRDFCGATRGNIYGTEKSRGQIGAQGFRWRTEIDGLHLVGASTFGQGVAAATVSGLLAAAKVLGCSLSELLRHKDGELQTYPCDNLSQEHGTRRQLRVVGLGLLLRTEDLHISFRR